VRYGLGEYAIGRSKSGVVHKDPLTVTPDARMDDVVRQMIRTDESQCLAVGEGSLWGLLLPEKR